MKMHVILCAAFCLASAAQAQVSSFLSIEERSTITLDALQHADQASLDSLYSRLPAGRQPEGA